ncbi:MAG: ferrous iron transport protein A [Magnetococcales bacterium]|nr:ferrous iron transport protein A [Magnetococcales bacterium]
MNKKIKFKTDSKVTLPNNETVSVKSKLKTKEKGLLTLADLPFGQKALIVDVDSAQDDAGRLMSLGLVRGAEVHLESKAPMGDPCIYSVLGYRLALRKADAKQVRVAPA